MGLNEDLGDRENVGSAAVATQRAREERAKRGGSLAENMTQAIARDLLADAMRFVEAEGIEVVMHVHDEIVAEVRQDRAEWALERMEEIMSTTPLWAKGLPLGAEGFHAKRYRK